MFIFTDDAPSVALANLSRRQCQNLAYDYYFYPRAAYFSAKYKRCAKELFDYIFQIKGYNFKKSVKIQTYLFLALVTHDKKVVRRLLQEDYQEVSQVDWVGFCFELSEYLLQDFLIEFISTPLYTKNVFQNLYPCFSKAQRRILNCVLCGCMITKNSKDYVFNHVMTDVVLRFKSNERMA